MVHTTPKFVKDTSKYWYKPNITREDGKQGADIFLHFFVAFDVIIYTNCLKNLSEQHRIIQRKSLLVFDKTFMQKKKMESKYTEWICLKKK